MRLFDSVAVFGGGAMMYIFEGVDKITGSI